MLLRERTHVDAGEVIGGRAQDPGDLTHQFGLADPCGAQQQDVGQRAVPIVEAGSADGHRADDGLDRFVPGPRSGGAADDE